MSKKTIYSNTFYIYKISHADMDKYYIGYRRLPVGITPEEDEYMGSSVILKGRGVLKGKGLYDKYGKENFIKTILKVLENSDRKTAEEYEKYYIKQAKENGDLLFNISIGGTGGDLGPEVRKIQSIKRLGKEPWNKGMHYTEEQKIKYNCYAPRKHNNSPESSKKRSESLKLAYLEGRKRKGLKKGFKYTDEMKDKMSKEWHEVRHIKPRKIMNITTGEIFYCVSEMIKKHPEYKHYDRTIKNPNLHCCGCQFTYVDESED